MIDGSNLVNWRVKNRNYIKEMKKKIILDNRERIEDEEIWLFFVCTIVECVTKKKQIKQRH